MKSITLALLTVAALTCHAFAQNTDADNSGKNSRDNSGETLTPIDQSNDPADLKITAETRKMLVADDSLSILAKNVKVITIAGAVTLRGPVESEKEKDTVAKHAKMAGATTVTNKLEIKQP